MISGISVRNFRGLRAVDLDGLARVNVIVGDNGSGKTALLEAIFLTFSNNSMVELQLKQIRGSYIPATVEKLVLMDWGGFDIIGEFGEEIIMETRGVTPFKRKFTLKLDPNRPNRVGGFNLAAGVSTNAFKGSMVYRWEDGDGAVQESELVFNPSPNAVATGSISYVEAGFIQAAYGGQGAAPAIFSDLDKTGQASGFIEALRKQFPELDTVSVQLEGEQAFLYARFKGQRQLRRLELHSGGLSRLSTILLMIARPSSRIVMIDEIENGLHHQRFRLLWRQIREFAVRADTQVFVTTHSLECLDAVADEMTDHPDDFALLRATRTDAGCVVGLLPGADARSLLRSGLEVRG